MGIPRLIRRLEPYAVPVSLKDVDKLIIDGPGLVYYIYYRLLSFADGSLNVFDGSPSYAAICNGVIAFLLEVCAQGVKLSVCLQDAQIHRH